MGNYTIFLKFENPRRGRQARNFSENDPKILDLKSSSEQIIFRKLSLGAPEMSSSLMVKFSIYATKIDKTLVSAHQWPRGTALKNERGLNPPC